MDLIKERAFEAALKRVNEKREISKVLNISSEPATAEYQNFLSTVKRLRVKMVLENGSVANRSFILKDSGVEEESAQSFIKDNSVFKVETLMYTVVLNELENLMDDYEDRDGVLWCKLLHYEPYTSLLFEDLQAIGFKSLTTPCYLDLDHGFLLLQSIARYHGLCKVLDERGMITKDLCKGWFVMSNRKTYQVWKECLNQIAITIRQSWGSHWNGVAEILEKVSLKYMEEKLNETKHLLEDKSPFKVLNHGDLNVGNIMLKYDWRHKPVDLRLIDFQLPAYASPCIDLMYVFYRHLDPMTRRRHFNQLLRCYHDFLLSTLQKYHYSGLVLSFDELLIEMEQVSYLGLFFAVINYVPIRDEQLSESETASKMTMRRIIGKYLKPEMEALLGQDIKELVEKLTAKMSNPAP